MADGETTNDESRTGDSRVLFSIGPDRIDSNEDLGTYVHNETVEFRFLIVLLITFVFGLLILGLEPVFYAVIRALGL